MTIAMQTENQDAIVEKAKVLFCEEAEKTFQEQRKLYRDLSTYLNLKHYLEEKEVEKRLRRGIDEQG